MGAEAPIFTRSYRSFRSLSWWDHSEQLAQAVTQIIQLGDYSDHSAGEFTYIVSVKLPALRAKAFNSHT